MEQISELTQLMMLQQNVNSRNNKEKPMDEVIQLNGKIPGSTSVVLACVHGNETCGVELFKNVLPSLQIQAGSVVFAYGNPRAIEADARFVEANLNRMFKAAGMLTNKEKDSYEYKRAQFLKPLLQNADALLDIHASTNPNSQPFVICEPNAYEITKFFPVSFIVSGFDAVEPGGTDYYMNSIGKVGICVECGYMKDPESSARATESLFAFLKARGHIENDLQPKLQTHIGVYSLYLTQTDNFILSKAFDDFEKVTTGQIIGTDGGADVKADRESVILFAQNLDKKGEEAFLLGVERPKDQKLIPALSKEGSKPR
jgi:succinylglutamate desuccinylase